ncbi:MAG: bacterial transcriptional activator domain-containing protein, partial [Acidimicrobiales bacterium]|nr:bacterial transcriptional activator domain-containing protein [Acidimicrobiales bacterium]
VNLSHLHKVLEPGAEPSTRRWFVRAEAEFLELCDDGLTVDAAELDEGCARARRLDDEGQGTAAIAAYEDAVARFRGDYLVDWPDAPWAEVERLRLRTLATGAMVRVGQLRLARGEPETAGVWAARVTRLEPLDDAAHRLFAQALAAQGNRAGAAATLRGLLARLAEERLGPERETVRLASSLGVDLP